MNKSSVMTQTHKLNNKAIAMNYELSLTSMKPLPSSSISKNLISRLNELSSPVARKLKFWNKKSFQVNQYDPSFKVIYLGNLGMQLWSKDESCLEKPLSTLWNNYLVNMKTEIVMRLTICNSGLKALTRQHGLTQYWSNRLVYCCSHKNYPKIFSWIYRHEGKKMRQELRCHAVFCPSPEKAAKMVTLLNQRLACALQEFRREKKSRGSSTIDNLSSSSIIQHRLQRTIPLRRQILAKGSANFRPPLERSKSAPKLTSILEEDYELEDEEASQDEFEYEQSFGDKDEDSDYGDDEVDELDGKDDDEEDNTHKIESNSLTTTVNEETSNSSVYATGDIPLQLNDAKSAGDTSIELNEDDNPSSNKGGHHINFDSSTNLRGPNSIYHIREDSFENSSLSNHDDKTKQINCHKTNQEDMPPQQSSANNTIQQSSSLNRKKHIIDNQDNDEGEETSSYEAKNNNTPSNNNHKEPQQHVADDVTTQEIILSWSNLVIK